MGADAVASQPSGVGMLQRARQAAVIGEQQQPFGGEIETADREQARQAFRQMIDYRRTAFRIVMRRHQPARLVIEKQPRALALRQWLAVDGDDIARRDVERRRIDNAAVDGNATLRDPFLRIAPRAQPCPRHGLGDPLAGLVLLWCCAWRALVRIRRPLAISPAPTKGRALGENLAVVLVFAARAFAALATRMLLPGVAARRTVVTIPLKTRTAETFPLALATFRTILARARKTRAVACTTIIAARCALFPRLVGAAVVCAIEFFAWTARRSSLIPVEPRTFVALRSIIAIESRRAWSIAARAILAEAFATRRVGPLLAKLLVTELLVAVSARAAGARIAALATRRTIFPRLEGASLATIARAKFLARTKLLTRATRRTITTIFARLERAALAAVIARRPVIALNARTRTIAITILAEALAFAGIRLGPMRFGSVGPLVAEAAPTGLFVTEFLVTELAVAAGRGGTRGALAGKPALAPIPVAAASRLAATRAGAASVVFIVVAGHVRSRLSGA